MKEYIVTLKNFDDLDEFYLDMETPGGNLYIPNRSVDLINRRPISRNTHYLLTDEEADQIRNDPRVLRCTPRPEDLGMELKKYWTQTSSDWNKSGSISNSHLNWGLLRCVEGAQRNNWGDNGTTSQTGTITVNAEGRNVDVVIVDGLIDANHPEMAKNSDGTGGTRVVLYNWLQHATIPGNYVYGPLTGTAAEADNNHGMHCAGTVAGNTQGWARSANIYNITPYGTDPNGVDILLTYDYIRAWHNTKPINPITGRRNPTITNNSYGFSYTPIPIEWITSVFYRGQTYTSNLTGEFLNSIGCLNDGYSFVVPGRYAPFDADISDAMDDGIIIVGSAGNDSYKVDVPNGVDYDNYVVLDGYAIIDIHKGSSPSAEDGVICVGSISTNTTDTKAWYSNCGPRIDIYSPGTYIMSSLHSGGINDLRNSNYRQGKYTGTSMAGPQVCGILTCLLEIYPNFTQKDVIEYIEKNSKYNQIPDNNNGHTDNASLQSGPNRYLFYYKERADVGTTWPKLNYKARPNNGRMYPRQRIRKTSI